MNSPQKKPSLDSFTETYFQITPDILASFPKFRPPMDLYLFKEPIAELVPFSYAGQRLSQAQLRELHEECANGNIFVARSDRHIYAQHISKQLDLILMDSKLKESEIAHILSQGLTDRFRAMFGQPVKTSLDLVQADLAILVQYLTIDPFRIKSLLRALPPGQSLEHQAYHTTVCGLALGYELLGAAVKTAFVRHMTLGLAMTPLGLCKIPAYIRNKKGKLTPDEQKAFLQHPLIGAAQLKKLGVRDETTLKCVLEHQERLDGSGFPQKLTQESISQAGRISGVASAFASHFSAPEPLPAGDILGLPSRLSQESSGLDPHLVNLLQTVLNSVYKTPSREGT
jgi:hypothetical protein